MFLYGKSFEYLLIKLEEEKIIIFFHAKKN
jgi:hypothetical protein